jgi:hypothetical protein
MYQPGSNRKLAAWLVAFGAGDAWTKVRALKTGGELRVFEKGATQPILAQMDELTDENLVVIVKKTQMAIPKEQIDRVDARPAGGGAKTDTTSKQSVDADGKETTSTSTGYSFWGSRTSRQSTGGRLARPGSKRLVLRY